MLGCMKIREKLARVVSDVSVVGGLTVGERCEFLFVQGVLHTIYFE